MSFFSFRSFGMKKERGKKRKERKEKKKARSWCSTFFAMVWRLNWRFDCNKSIHFLAFLLAINNDVKHLFPFCCLSSQLACESTNKSPIGPWRERLLPLLAEVIRIFRALWTVFLTFTSILRRETNTNTLWSLTMSKGKESGRFDGNQTLATNSIDKSRPRMETSINSKSDLSIVLHSVSESFSGRSPRQLRIITSSLSRTRR